MMLRAAAGCARRPPLAAAVAALRAPNTSSSQVGGGTLSINQSERALRRGVGREMSRVESNQSIGRRQGSRRCSVVVGPNDSLPHGSHPIKSSIQFINQIQSPPPPPLGSST
jgi:hypothetical protein